MSKVVAALGILVGAIGGVFELLVAFGVHLTSDQQTAIASVAAVGLAVLGVWFHPSLPIGAKSSNPQ